MSMNVCAFVSQNASVFSQVNFFTWDKPILMDTKGLIRGSLMPDNEGGPFPGILSTSPGLLGSFRLLSSYLFVSIVATFQDIIHSFIPFG